MAATIPVTRRWVVAAMLLLTAATGLIDAVSYLGLGQVFVANMTGNVVFLGFTLAPDSGLSVVSPLAAIASFVVGSVLGGRLGTHLDRRPRHWLGAALGTEAAGLTAVALLAGLGMLPRTHPVALIAALALCFGLQNATIRRLAPADLTTTVLTMTLTGLAADSVLGGGTDAKPHRRLGSVAAMLAGAATGALLLRLATAYVIGLAAVLVVSAAAAFVLAPANEPARQHHLVSS